MQNVLPDIPRLYTAIAEWGACMIFILLLPKRFSAGRLTAVCTGALVIQSLFLELTAGASTYLWILYMIIAVVIMMVFLICCCQIHWKDMIYFGTFAFILAEFIASLEWQIYCLYFYSSNMEGYVWKGLPFLLFCYVLFYLFYWWLLNRQKSPELALNVHTNELWPVLIIAVLTFTVSNLSFVAGYLPVLTPFTSNYGDAVFTIRTMVDLSGVAMMYASYMLRCEVHLRQELDAMQQMFQNQYRQYEQSKESIDMINYKYHDLKHQIAVLRAEEDPEKRSEYLNQMEEEIQQYEAQNKTGNKVLDTILTSKTMTCQKNEISLNCVADGKLLDFIDDMDLCSILGNAFDNAIECEMKISDKEKRLIHVAIFSQKNFLILRFENYFEGKLDKKDGFPKTTKKEKESHGYGLKSIQYTVEKYHGAVNISTQDNWFELKILIPIPQKGEITD